MNRTTDGPTNPAPEQTPPARTPPARTPTSPRGPGEDPGPGPTPFAADPETLRVAGDPAMGPPSQRVRRAALSEQPLTATDMAEAVTDPRCGAVVTFDGVVRDHDDGRGVERLEYAAHPTAAAAITAVAHEIAGRYPDVLVAVAHHHGPLEIGDSALVCAVAAPHRKQAFVACDDLVDAVKQQVPIWKHQIFEGGESEWVGALG